MAATDAVWCLVFQLTDGKNKALGSAFRVARGEYVADFKKNVRLESEVDAPPHMLEVWRCKDRSVGQQSSRALIRCIEKFTFSEESADVESVDPETEIVELGLGSIEKLLVQVPEMVLAPAATIKRKIEENDQPAEKRLRYEYEDYQERYAKAAREYDVSASDAAKISMFPKVQRDVPVFNGRAGKSGIPIQLFHPIFDDFRQKLDATSSDDIPDETHKLVHDFILESSKIYKLEEHRELVISPILQKLLDTRLEKLDSTKDCRVKSDGVATVTDGRFTAYPIIFEMKNEIGTGDSDPFNQVSVAYQKYWVQGDEEWTTLRRTSYCPSFLIALAGPWMCVAGAVMAENPIIQLLTDYVWIGERPQRLSDISKILNIFHALKSSTKQLVIYYRSFLSGLTSSRLSVQPTRGFPYITEYAEQSFTYVDRLVQDDFNKIVFKILVEGKLRVVKFTAEYNEDAHRKLAAEGFAPALHYVSKQKWAYGGLVMVVMDFVDGTILEKGGMLSKQHYSQVREALDILHRSDLVFGDLRPPNILLTKDRAMLVDFDWCKQHKDGKYPLNINMSVSWVDGVGPRELMLKEHDNAMLNKLYYHFQSMDQ